MNLNYVYVTDTGGALEKDEFFAYILMKIEENSGEAPFIYFTEEYWGDSVIDKTILDSLKIKYNKLKQNYANRNNKFY